jgi:peptide/nickel transport system substrate-binding protein
MRKKVLLFTVSLLFMGSFVMAAGGQEAAPKAAMSMAEVVPGGGELAASYGGITVPQYGGTFTAFIGKASTEAADPDTMSANPDAFGWLCSMLERPIYGDVETYGGFGTGEWAFQTNAYQPDDYQTPWLLESYEVFPDKIVWTVRQGVQWAPTDDQIKRGVMDGPRDLVAEDIAKDVEYFRSSPMGGRFDDILGDVYATSKYEVVLEMPVFSPDKLMYFLGYEDRSTIEAPETNDFDPHKYENYVGTGPFQFEEYVVGSHMSFTRNPIYWDTVTIGGKEYQRPFVDRMVWPIIPDVSTRIAALRTASIDFHTTPSIQDWESLDKTNPELLSAAYADSVRNVALKSDEPPFDNREVRRAMMIGTDLASTRRLIRCESLPMHAWPIYYGNADIYTPIEELSDDLQMLYKYDPEKAKQMLSAAGYPNGFEIDYYVPTTVMTAGVPETDIASLIAEQWAKIGIDVNIVAQEWLTFRENQYSRTYSGAISAGTETANPVLSLVNSFSTGGFLNEPVYSSAVVDDYITQITEEENKDKRNVLIKEVASIILGDVPKIPIGMVTDGHYWWPWVRNHFGERAITDGQHQEIFGYLWIDQGLRKEMGHKQVGTPNRQNP